MSAANFTPKTCMMSAETPNAERGATNLMPLDFGSAFDVDNSAV